MPDKVTLRIAVEADASKFSLGRGLGSSHTVTVGRFEGRGPTKTEAVAEVVKSLAAAVSRSDLGCVVAVGVAAGEVHVLSSRHDGAYEISRAPLPVAGETSRPLFFGPHMQDRGNAVDIFADRVASAHAERRANQPSCPDAESTLRMLAVSVGVSVDDAVAEPLPWRDVAQRTAAAFQRSRSEADTVRRSAEETRQIDALAAEGWTPEARALARLLGLRGAAAPGGLPDAGEVRREALAILAESAGERWGQTLTDARAKVSGSHAAGPRGWLQVIGSLVRGDGIEDEIQERVDNGVLVETDKVEQVAVDRGWKAGGPIDKAFADDIEKDELPSEADKALVKRLEAAKAEAVAEERERVETASPDGCVVCDQTRGALADLLADDYEDGMPLVRAVEALGGKIAEARPILDAAYKNADRLIAENAAQQAELAVAKLHAEQALRAENQAIDTVIDAREFADNLQAGLTLVREELDNRGILRALPPAVRALIERTP